MTKIYECGTCGVVTSVPEQACAPRRLENMGTYCDTTTTDGEMCHDKKAHLAFVCGNCGRPADQADLVCDPLQTR